MPTFGEPAEKNKKTEKKQTVRGESGESSVMEEIQGRKDFQGGRSGQQSQTQQRFPIRPRQKVSFEFGNTEVMDTHDVICITGGRSHNAMS